MRRNTGFIKPFFMGLESRMYIGVYIKAKMIMEEKEGVGSIVCPSSHYIPFGHYVFCPICGASLIKTTKKYQRGKTLYNLEEELGVEFYDKWTVMCKEDE